MIKNEKFLLKNWISFKAKASTVIESVIAITIISVCILAATLAFVSVVKTDESIKDIQSKQQFFKYVIYNADVDDEQFDQQELEESALNGGKVIKCKIDKEEYRVYVSDQK